MTVSVFDGVRSFEDEVRGLRLLLYGRLYDGMSLQKLAAAYERDGARCLRSCNGSFGLLLVDAAADRVLVATDRLGSKPLYVSSSDGVTLVSSRLRQLVGPHSAIDPAGLAWYLTLGVVHTDRTILADVARVPRASVVTCAPDGCSTDRYWEYRFTHEYAGRDEEQLRDELAGLLVEAVRKRSREDTEPRVSLSAGVDSRGVFGILTGLVQQEACRSFSYGMDEGLEGSDACLAARVADACGSRHQFLLAYDGRLADAIELNARWGDGITSFCDEVLSWELLRTQCDGGRPPAFFGDTCFVGAKVEIDTPNRVLAAHGLRSFGGLKWIRPLLGGQVYDQLLEAQHADMRQMKEDLAAIGEPIDMLYYQHVEQYLCHVILPWRESYAARIFAVQEPLLDNDLFDFVARLPAAPRRAKRLYKETVARLVPEALELPTASARGCVIDWRDELQRKAPSYLAADDYAAVSAPVLDHVIDPGIVAAVLAMDEAGQASEETPVRGHGLVARSRRKFARLADQEPVRHVSAADFVRRYLVLRRFLQLSVGHSLRTEIEAGRTPSAAG